MKEEIYSNRFPHPLSPAEEKECLLKMHEGDKAAKDKLIMHNMRLVAYIANKFFFPNEKEDLISIGFFGLLKGLETYRMDKNVKLASYLGKCIKNEIIMYMRKIERDKDCLSFEQSMRIHNDEEGPNLLSVLTQRHINDLNDAMLSFDAHDQIEKLMQVLTDKEKQVISMHYGLNGYSVHTHRKIGEMMNYSRTYISRIEEGALNKMREMLHYSDICHDADKNILPLSLQQ